MLFFSSPRQPKSRIVRWFGLLAALALAACGQSEEKNPEADGGGEGRPVLVAPAQILSKGQAREFAATIQPRIVVDQAFRVTGKVVRRFVQAGQRVKSGEVLALLDEKDLKLQKEQAEADLAAASLALVQAAGDERRTLTLHKDGWTAQAAVDRARAAAQEARGRVLRAERAVELSRNALDYATLRADGDGVVIQALVEPGQVVAAGQTAVRVARTGELEAAVSLPEDFARDAGNGEATLTLWSNRDRRYAAKLRELSPSADPATRTFGARYSIIDPDPTLALGMSATLGIANRGSVPVARVPLSALFNQGGGPAVWRVDADSRLQLLPVKLVRYETGSALVTGLPEGAMIVVLGAHKLEAGRKVRTILRPV